jgi:hypothetical protein
MTTLRRATEVRRWVCELGISESNAGIVALTTLGEGGISRWRETVIILV